MFVWINTMLLLLYSLIVTALAMSSFQEVLYSNDTTGLINTTQTDLIVDDLQPGTAYKINIAAQTSAGVSREVRSTTIITCESYQYICNILFWRILIIWIILVNLIFCVCLKFVVPSTTLSLSTLISMTTNTLTTLESDVTAGGLIGNTASTSVKPNDDGLSKREWALIIGVSVAAIFLIILIVALLCVLCRKHQKNHSGNFGEFLLCVSNVC